MLDLQSVATQCGLAFKTWTDQGEQMQYTIARAAIEANNVVKCGVQKEKRLEPKKRLRVRMFMTAKTQ